MNRARKHLKWTHHIKPGGDKNKNNKIKIQEEATHTFCFDCFFFFFSTFLIFPKEISISVVFCFFYVQCEVHWDCELEQALLNIYIYCIYFFVFFNFFGKHLKICWFLICSCLCLPDVHSCHWKCPWKTELKKWTERFSCLSLW